MSEQSASAAPATILAIETATEGCSVALETPEGLFEHCEEAPRAHAQRLLPMLDTLLHEAGVTRSQIDALAYGCGPGGFVGVRLATSVAQGLCTAWQIPALAVSTLEGLASGAWRRTGAERVVAALDARMGQVYWGVFGHSAAGLMQPLAGERVSDPAALVEATEALPAGEWFAVGRGFAAYPELTPLPQRPAEPATEPATEPPADSATQLRRRDTEALPQARDLLPRAQQLWCSSAGLAPHEALPVYLRSGV
ncbi:tRNA (adenosine(37)-N6)-threonylcarbamoyltransferase complex dimerization subunit type 1 TsaB [Halorhodospira abdelmalekii]|nr:tRNA (adenosine(37)-N6)-threonylcarbamoyltransferase complex dimerization subunit type 1 TsaB [Halorhodospira abdelmalekii]